MSQQAQARGLHDQGVQLFEEARRNLEDALGRASEANEKLKSGELTDEALSTWKEKFDQAMTDAAALKKKSAELANLRDGLEEIDATAEALGGPNYKRPMGATGPGPGDDEETLGVVAGGSQTIDPNWGPSDEKIVLQGRARTLLNRLIRQNRPGAMQDGPKLSAAEVKFLTADRPETLMSPYINRDGGMITAEEVRNEVIGHLRDMVYIRGRARVIPTTAASVSFPTARIDLTLRKNRAGVGTGVSPAKLSDVFGKTRFTPSGKSEIVKVPIELLEDATFDVIGFISEEIAMNTQEQEEGEFLTGSGSGGPLGVLTALEKLTTAGYTGLYVDHSGSGAAFTPDDIKQWPYNLKKKYRAGASWMAPRSFYQVVTIMRTEPDGAGSGDYLFRSGIREGDPDLLAGYPTMESEFFPDNIAAGSDGDPLVLFGDWRHYWIIDRKSLMLRVLGELYQETDEIGYKYERRYDAAPVRADAFVVMAHK